MAHIFEEALDRTPANYTALTPINFLLRSGEVYGDKTAIIHGSRTITYHEFAERCRRLASALSELGIRRGDTVSIMAPNVPAMLEAHFGVPMCGAVLNPLNTRLDAATIRFILEHGESKLLVADRAFSDVVRSATAGLAKPPTLVCIDDDPTDQRGEPLGEMDYEELLRQGSPDGTWSRPEDEWQAISLNYTSGTTGNPKGVVIHHRGAYLQALSDCLSYRVRDDAVYLWTLPMFHCNGWGFTWAVTAAGGTHVCLRQVEPSAIFTAIAEHRVTHLCGAPVVLNTLINAPAETRLPFAGPVLAVTGGAAPPSAVIFAMENMGFCVVHAYGLTESYGPSSTCVWKPDWDGLDLDARAAKTARQGVRQVGLDEMGVFDRVTGKAVPADGATIGELRFRGNTVMKGYLKNPSATQEALEGGWFHSGDLAVMHSDGYMEVKDRSKDIIISGGENISSLEVEEVLFRHPAVLEAAVVARPDAHWGETPCAFVTLKDIDDLPDEQSLIDFCRDNMAHFKAPKVVVFTELPKTSTGKIQKTVLRDRARTLP